MFVGAFPGDRKGQHIVIVTAHDQCLGAGLCRESPGKSRVDCGCVRIEAQRFAQPGPKAAASGFFGSEKEVICFQIRCR